MLGWGIPISIIDLKLKRQWISVLEGSLYRAAAWDEMGVNALGVDVLFLSKIRLSVKFVWGKLQTATWGLCSFFNWRELGRLLHLYYT